MAIAVTLLLDAGTEKQIRRYWSCLSDGAISQSMIELGYPPHITLAIYDERSPDTVIGALDALLGKQPALNFVMNTVATFGPDSGVLYAALTRSEPLQQLHTDILSGICGNCHPHYRPPHWTPHCTLAKELSETALDEAKATVERDWQPIEGLFEWAELVEVSPINVIKRWALKSPQSIRTP